MHLATQQLTVTSLKDSNCKWKTATKTQEGEKLRFGGVINFSAWSRISIAQGNPQGTDKARVQQGLVNHGKTKVL